MLPSDFVTEPEARAAETQFATLAGVVNLDRRLHANPAMAARFERVLARGPGGLPRGRGARNWDVHVREDARVAHAVDLFVRKRPTTLAKCGEQRRRQAYEDFGMRTRTWLFAALIPALLIVGALAGARVAPGVVAGSTWWALCCRLRHSSYPFGNRRLTRGTGRAWEAGGRVPVARDRAA